MTKTTTKRKKSAGIESVVDIDYETFLRNKSILHVPTGIESEMEIHASLFPFQALLTKWALHRGRAALFVSTGLGKTIMQCEFARHVEIHTGKPVLILAPLAVAQQTCEEAERHLSLKVTIAAGDADIGERGIYVTNYAKLHKFDPSKFSGVVLDECFAPGTMVECFENGIVYSKDIRYVRANDRIINAAGIDTVRECHRRPIQRAYAVSFGGKRIIASENHPWLTHRGWVPTRMVRKTDWLLESCEAMRMVREFIYPEECSGGIQAFLREVLLSEMEDESARAFSEGSYQGNSRQDWEESIGMVEKYRSRKAQCGEDYSLKSNGTPGSQAESEPRIESDGARTFRAWGKWDGNDKAAIIALGGTFEWVGERVSLVTWNKESRLSDLLQTGYCQPDSEDQHRSGWSVASSLGSESSRSEARCNDGFIGVDGIEILEPGHPELEQFRDSDGNVYFYDIGLTRHPSFTVNGALVHNSSILKSLDGATASALIRSFKQTPFRLVCTATPAPNDIDEIGAYCDFLGVMSATEMLATFFVHDSGETSKWRLKGHAEEEFWRWMASWAACVRLPSDIGCDNSGYILPELRTHEIIVDSTIVPDGELFAVEAASLDERRQARRESIDDRVAAAAKLARIKSKGQFAIWCGLNSEQDAIAAALKGECVSIQGSTSDEDKIILYNRWRSGEVRILVSKVALFGFGVNMQFCCNTIFLGLSDSFEAFYQAVRRFWRFGQKNEVDAYIIISQSEGAVLKNIKRKQADAEKMQAALATHMAEFTKRELVQQTRETTDYNPTKKMILPEWLQTQRA